MASRKDLRRGVTELDRHTGRNAGRRWTELWGGESSASQKEAQQVSYTEVNPEAELLYTAGQGGGVITYR